MFNRAKRFTILLVLSLLFLYGCESTASLLKTNWNLSIPEPDRVEVVYPHDREGNAFEIWHYDQDAMKIILGEKRFVEITEKNMEEVKESLDVLYNVLTDKNEKYLFRKSFDKNDIKLGDFYCFKEINSALGGDSSLLLYLDFPGKTLYYFSDIG